MYRSLTFLFFAILFATNVQGATLKEYLPALPRYFAKKYSATELRFKTNETLKYPRLTVRHSNTFNNSRGNAFTRKIFVFEYPPAQNVNSVQIALAFLQLMRTHDANYSTHVRSLDQMGYRNEAQRSYEPFRFLEKIEKYGAQKIAGQNPTADALIELWWRLKFSDENQLAARSPKKGEPVLLALRQYGYFKRSESHVTNLRRRLDFGHAALGIRFVGQGPEGDLYLNPGSKDFDLNEVGLPNAEDPQIMNAVAVHNLWHWMEIQIYHRYLGVSAHVLALNDLQREALKILLPKVRGINFGPAIVIKNDCVDGVARLATFILPINKSMDAEIFSNFGTPKQYQREMARVFPNLAWKLFDFTNIRSHNPANETPSTGMEVIFEDLRQTHSFKEFRSYESLWALL